MKIGVVGPGALGCLCGAMLGLAGHEIRLLDHRPERARLLTAHGLIFHDLSGRQHLVPITATADPEELGPLPLLFLCVKAGDVLTAAAAIRPLATAGTLVVALQNGISHHQGLSELLPTWALGVTAQGATLDGPLGHVRHGGSGPTYLGFLAPTAAGASQRLALAATVLTQAAIPAEVCPDIRAKAWNKLIVNAGINALTALEDCPNGELLNRPAALARLTAAVQEAALVARAYGIAVDPDPLAMTMAVCRQTRDNISSMLQDIRHGRVTEIEAINGEVVRLAARLGLAVPANQVLLAGVLALQSGGRASGSP